MNTSRPPGFTLLELMVALLVSAVLVVVLAQLAGTALESWRRSNDQREAERLAHILFETLEADLRATLRRPRVPSADMASAPERVWISVVPQLVGGRSTSRLALVAPVFDQEPAVAPDLHAVHYVLAPHASRDGANLAVFRAVQNPGPTTMADWSANGWPAASQIPRTGLLGEGFSDLQIALEVVDANGAVQLVEADQSPRVVEDSTVTWPAAPSGSRHRLAAVHVRAEVLTSAGRRLLEAAGYGAVPESEKRPLFKRIELTGP